MSDKSDCQYKLSSFIGSVNKLIANFGNLQQDVIARLLKSYCCSFYGSQAWQIDSTDYKRICVTWNKSVRKILKLPYTTHTWILGPLLDQSHLHYQLQPWAPAGGGGGQEGALGPPLEIQKYRGPHKDNLTRKLKKKYI